MLEYARIFQNLTAGVFFSLWAGWGKDMMICQKKPGIYGERGWKMGKKRREIFTVPRGKNIIFGITLDLAELAGT